MLITYQYWINNKILCGRDIEIYKSSITQYVLMSH